MGKRCLMRHWEVCRYRRVRPRCRSWGLPGLSIGLRCRIRPRRSWTWWAVHRAPPPA